jgi:hypothetical protein
LVDGVAVGRGDPGGKREERILVCVLVGGEVIVVGESNRGREIVAITV